MDGAYHTKTGSWMRNSTKNPATSNEKVSRKFLSHVVCTNPSITTLDNFVQMGRFQDDGSGLPPLPPPPKNHEGDRPLGYLPHLYKSTLQSKHSKPSYNFWECFTVVDIILDRIQTGNKNLEVDVFCRKANRFWELLISQASPVSHPESFTKFRVELLKMCAACFQQLRLETHAHRTRNNSWKCLEKGGNGWT